MIYTIVFMLLFAACTEGRLMNYERYQGVVMGESIAQMQLSLGKAYEIKDVGGGRQEYIFLERIPLADGRELFRRYIFVVENSKIISKYINEEMTSPIMLHG